MEKRSLKAMREEIDKQLVVEEVKSVSPFEQLQALSQDINEMTESFSQDIDELSVSKEAKADERPKSLMDILAKVEHSAESLDDDLAAIFEKKRGRG